MTGTRLTTLALAILILHSLAACGGGGGSDGGSGGGGQVGTAPTISNLSFSPEAAYVDTDGGQVNVIGTVDFADPDGDIESLTIVVLDSTGQVIDDITALIEGIGGSASGTIQGELVADTSVAGTYTVRVHVTDSRNHQSNRLEDIFRVTEFPWVEKQAMLLPRRDFATATLGGDVYVLGGGDLQAGIIPAPPTTTVQVYDPESDTWIIAPSMLRAVTNHVAVALDGKIYVIGGEEEFVPMSDVMQEYDPATQMWTQRASMPTARRSAAAAALGGRIFVVGGSSGGMDVAAVEAYDPATNSWTSLAPLSEPRRDLGAAVVGGELFVLGGYTGMHIPDAGYRRLVEVYDAAGNTWSVAEDMPIPRADFACAVVGTDLIVAGGGNWARGLDDVSTMDAPSGTWHMKTAIPENMGLPRGEAIDDKMYVIDSDDTYEYTPGNDIL
ncbi:MAG: hypothetical protein KJP17_07245 [Gammaproteobacteria bacterium]|nr:hypothetical protein [Gammaproteobacteria bacterium]